MVNDKLKSFRPLNTDKTTKREIVAIIIAMADNIEIILIVVNGLNNSYPFKLVVYDYPSITGITKTIQLSINTDF